MAGTIYMLCALTAFACAWLLLRSYLKNSNRLLLWSGLCFFGMFLHNLLRVLDDVLLPQFDLSVTRMLIGLFSLMLMLFGLIWEDE